MAAVTICSDFGAQENKVCHCFPISHCFIVSFLIVSPSICLEVMGPDANILVFWMLSFKPTFPLSSFTFIKRHFSSFFLSAIRVVSSAYLRSIFLLAIYIPAYASSSPAFPMMYSEYKLNKQGWHYTALTYSFPNLEPVCCSMSGSNCCFLTCRQISQEAGKVVWYYFFKNFNTLLWSTYSKILA